MFTYYRSSSHNTHIQRILRGSISNPENIDIVLVKDNCFEWYKLQHVTDLNPTLLQKESTQSCMGTILDAQLLKCQLEQEQDLIVAISEYGHVVFITIQHDRFEKLAQICLDSPGLEFTKNGRKLAIDPYGRAIAVSSFQDHFEIMILNKRMSKAQFNPIAGKGSELEEGIIWHMEFLYTENTSMDRILLVLVVYNDVEKLCRLVLYAINASDIEHIIIEKVSRLPLEKNTPLPLLFIPLKFEFESFLLVTEQHVSLLTADDLACGNVLYPSSNIPKQIKSTEVPLFTAFASHLDPDARYIYIGSEDGTMYKLVIQLNGEITWIPIHRTNPISQSMCMIGTINMNQEHDVILYAGEGANSQLIAIPNQHQLNKANYIVLQEFVNCAPLIDYQVIENYRDNQDAIVACTGQNEQGCLSIITHGIEATLLQSSKPEWAGISKIWNLPLNLEKSYTFLLATSMLDTRLFIAKDGHIQNIACDLDADTIYASIFAKDNLPLILQVCPQNISVISIDIHDNVSIILQWKPSHDEYKIELAACFSMDDKVYIVLFVAYSDCSMLELVKIVDDISVEKVFEVELTSCPSYIGYLDIGFKPTLLLGTYDTSLLLFNVTSESLELTRTIDLSCFGSFSIPQSSMILHSPNAIPYYLIVGLRQGSFLSFKLDNDGIEDERPFCYDIGTLPVSLNCSHQTNAMYAVSEDLWKMTCTHQGTIELERVLLPKYNHISAFIPFDCGIPQLIDQTSEPILMIADKKLDIFRLNLKSQKVIQKIHIGETPRKVVYDKTLNYFVVITTLSENGENNHCIRLLDAISGKSMADPIVIEREFNMTSVFLSAAEWSVKSKKKTYTFLCVGLGHIKEYGFKPTSVSRNSITKGTLMLFRIKPNRTKEASLKCIWQQKRLPSGVYAICPHPAGLLFSAGNHLYLYRLDPIQGKLAEIAHTQLPFDISSIQGDENRICVTSPTNSIAFYQLNPDSNTIEFYKSDMKPRNVRQSFMINSQLVVGASQSGGMIALHDNAQSAHRLETVFAFHHSDMITKPSLALLRPQNDIFNDDTNPLRNHVLSWTNHTVKPIIGCTVSGGIVQVYKISESLYYLLDTLQDLLLEFKPTEPLLGTADNFKSWYCELSGGQKSTIYGDVVESYQRLTYDEQVKIVQDEYGNIRDELKEKITACFGQVNTIQHAAQLLRVLLSSHYFD